MSPATQISAPTPIINFACPSSGKNAAILMAHLEAAVAEANHWGPMEDKLSLEFNKAAQMSVQPKPKALREAERKVTKAHRAWTAAEQAITCYRPQSLQEVVELLTFCSRDGEIFPDEYDLKRVMQNAAEALAEYAHPKAL